MMEQKEDISGLLVLFQFALAFIVFSVWTWRATMKTPFRGLDKPSLYGEFEAYGYPKWVFQVVGPVKLSFATALIFGLIYPTMTLVGAAGIMVLMLGAFLSHIKVCDGPLKTAPSATFAALCFLMIYAQQSSSFVVVDDAALQFPSVLATMKCRTLLFVIDLVCCGAMAAFAVKTKVYKGDSGDVKQVGVEEEAKYDKLLGA